MYSDINPRDGGTGTTRKKGVDKKKIEYFRHLDQPKSGKGDSIGEIVHMMLDYWEYQSEVQYETNKIQSILLASTAATIGVGWAGVFYGLAESDELMVVLGLAMAFGTMYVMLKRAPTVLDNMRRRLLDLGATKFTAKWLLPEAPADVHVTRPGTGKSDDSQDSTPSHIPDAK
jgi:hypothetical protein